MSSRESRLSRLAKRLVRSFALLVPAPQRQDWLREWEAELISRRRRLQRQGQLNPAAEFEVLLRALGSLRHALWLRRRAWRNQMFMHDFRLAVRALSKHFGFTLVMLSTLTLGIGSTTAIFTVVDHVLLRPLPYPEADELLLLSWRSERDPRITSIPYLDFLDLKEQAGAFEDIGLWTWFGGTLRTPGDPAQVWGFQVSENLLELLSVQPMMGRSFTPAESRQGARVTILSHSLWLNEFGANPALLGKAITIDDQAYEVVGILPEGFDLEFPRRGATLWVPLDPSHNWTRSRSIYTYYALGRARPGATQEAIQADLSAISRRLQKEFPETNQDRLYYAIPFRNLVVGDVRTTLWLLAGSVGILLLILCANLTNLLLARGLARTRELALRQALGARRFQIVRQLTVENLVFCLLGGVGGVLASSLLVPFLLRLAPAALPRSSEISIDTRVIFFSFGLSFLLALTIGILPGLKASGLRLKDALREGDDRLAPSSGRPFLVAAQIALALTLMAGTGLLISSLFRLLEQDPGFSPRHGVSLQIRPPESRYPRLPDLLSFLERARAELSAKSAIQTTGVVSSLPLSGHNSGASLSIEGKSLPESRLPSVGWQFISPEYLEAMGIQLIAGRNFRPPDLTHSRHYSLINRAAAERFFPGEDPLGRRIEVGVPQGEWHEIVGIVEDVRHMALDEEPQPRVYDLLGQHWGRTLYLVVRGSGSSNSLMATVRETFRTLDPELPLQELQSLEQLVRASTETRRFLIQILSLFGAVALVLAGVGIYGVISVWVARRRKEIGLRIALGAGRFSVVRLVLGQVSRIALLGMLLGWLASWLLGRYFESLLYGVSPGDPVTIAAATLPLAAVILLAAYLPIRRALRIDPLDSLRAE